MSAQGNKLNEQVGMPRGKPAKLAGKKVIPNPSGAPTRTVPEIASDDRPR